MSINQMIQIIEEIADYKVKKLSARQTQGVRGRSSDNTYVNKKIGWKPNFTLREGLEKTYVWIEQQILGGSNIDKFSKSNIEKMTI